MLADKKTLSTEKGITLIEIIVSVSLIALIIIAILPAITHSFIVIKKTKDNLVEHFFAQRYVEIIASTTEQCLLADGTTIPIINGQFPLRISGGTARNIVGGYVKRNDVLNFLAGIPHISINPYRLNEGYLPENYAAGPPYALRRSINITGYNTHFRTGLTSFRLVDFNSNNISGCTLSINSRTSARLDIPLNLLSSNSPYVIELQTGTEKVNAILLILLPDRMAIGKDPLTNLNRIIISSENPSYWIMRTPPSPGTVLLKDILFYNDSDDPLQNSKYLAAGSSGKIFFLKHGLPWQQAVTNCTQNLNHICWSQVQKMFVAVGDQGTILTASYSADYWIPRSSGVNTDLKNVVWDDINNQFIAIGQRGTIISSTDGIHWVNQVDEFTDQDDIRSRLQPVLWLDAAQGLQTGNDIHSGGGNITDGQKVQRWLDLSNYHNNATVKREPFKEYDAMGNLTNTTYYGPELEPGFNPGIKFDEYDDHLMITNTLAPGNSGRSIFIVTKNNNDTSEQKRFYIAVKL
ncbi:hypothetical protein [Syntrophomonas palmitatica]|uniref:hypothetical protein n=1 Tax=Syntrophomonas palmitatica TaxID=402877 RepID=UPI0006CFF8EF|nr:hypothetical protein [Syntrophomonas palmitatica]